MRDVFENIPNVNAYLEFSNKEALYYVEDKMQNEGKIIFNVNRTFAGGDNKYYKNSETKEYFIQNDVFEELLLIEMIPIKWKITQESKKIGNYLCFKAETSIERENSKGKFNQKIIAWFAPELPYNFGPKEFNGLPGLIIELKEGNNLTFRLMKLNNLKNKKTHKRKKNNFERI